MEITITELMLFAWAIIATGYALKLKEEKNHLGFLMNKFLEDDDLRNDMVGKFKQFKESRNGR